MTPDTRAPEYEDEPAPPRRNPESPMLNETEARQALPLGHMRYVLGVSLALVIIAFAVIYLTYFRMG
ncbi:MAG: hypothetical protein ACKVOI_12685 [Dongiaceae bacterium]